MNSFRGRLFKLRTETKFKFDISGADSSLMEVRKTVDNCQIPLKLSGCLIFMAFINKVLLYSKSTGFRKLNFSDILRQNFYLLLRIAAPESISESKIRSQLRSKNDFYLPVFTACKKSSQLVGGKAGPYCWYKNSPSSLALSLEPSIAATPTPVEIY